jgi:hypothetical protein
MNSVLQYGCVLLAICLLFGFATPVGGELAQQDSTASQTTITANGNGTNYLSPATSETEGYTRVSADVSSAASISAQMIQSQHNSQSRGEQLSATPQDNREIVANAQIDDIETQLLLLARQQRNLYDAYSAGELSDQQFLRNLAMLEVVAESQVENYERAVRNTELDIERLSQLETLADGLTPERPVLNQLTETMMADRETQVAYIQGAEDGLVIATVANGQFTRQATVLSERNFDGRDQFKLAQNISIDDDEWATPQGYSEAQTRLSEFYPWAYSIRQIEPGAVNPLSRIYGFDMPNPQGELKTYFDGATRNVFHENQAGSVENYKIKQVVSNTTDSLTVTLGLTHGSGPLRVTVDDNGQPVTDATVRMGGDRVGSVDDDGRLWTVQPRSEFEVTVRTAEGETVRVGAVD